MKGAFKKYFIPLFLLAASFLLIIPKLGNTPLKSWDEAWYAEISRNIARSDSWFLLSWNGLPYYDHPPAGFWAVAFLFKLLGITEFSARLPSALSGLGSIFLLYAIGKKLFNRTVGFSASIILLTTPWFWLRSREGNLDIILVFFLLLSLYLTLLAKERPKLLPFVFASAAFLLLTKTAIGAGIIPVLVYLFLKPRGKIKVEYLAASLVIFFLIFLPWYFINYQAYGLSFIDRNIFVTGLKQAGHQSFGSSPFQFKLYPQLNTYNLHMGILLWFKPFVVAFIGSFLFLKRKGVRALILFLSVYLFLLFSSPKTELWHYIIIYPGISLIIPAFIYNFSAFGFLVLEKISKRRVPAVKTYFPAILTIGFVFFTSFRIVSGLYRDIVKDNPVNDELILSREMGKNEGAFYIDDDYWPAAVFYSQKRVFSLPLSNEIPIKNIPQVFEKSSRPFLILTKKWILDRDKINPRSYEILKQVGDRVLIRSK